MRRHPIVGLICFLLVLAGCETVPQPSIQARRDSGAKAPKLDDRAVFYLFCSDAPLKVTAFVGNGASFNLKFDHSAPFFGALATAFTNDGYMMTAGHVARSHVLVIGMMNGQARAVFARVVYKGSFGAYGTDLAILHVDASTDFPLPLGQFIRTQNDVYAMAGDRESEFKVVVIGGKVRNATRSKASDQITLLDTDLPSWHGDSGGGVVSHDGKLIGVITGFKMKWSALHNAKLVCAPSKDFVDTIVAVDRAKFASRSDHASNTR